MLNRIVEYVFFFGFMAVVGYLLWLMFQPFISALALSAIIVTICYPMYDRVLKFTPRHNATLAALISTLLVLVIIILPLLWLTSILVSEAVAVYKMLGDSQHSVIDSLKTVEKLLQGYVPSFELNLTEYLKQSAAWLAGNLGAIFAGTASTIFAFFIALIGSFYFFRDGREFTRSLVRISPLPDREDEKILHRMAVAVRSVATGTVLIALIQGILTAIGLAFFGFERAILLGTFAAVGALVPSVGTSIVLLPSIGYLVYVGDYVSAGGLAVWAA
jgi:predicted PurR-regulated permease PerM